MSIVNQPPGEGASPPPSFQCLACYDVGSTAITVYMCLAGIKIGAAWVPGDPPPPNGVHILTIVANCAWTNLGANEYVYMMLGPFTFVVSRIAGGVMYFFYQGLPTCQLWQPNSLANPAGVKYYGGWCMVVPQIEGGAWSLPELMHLMDDDQYWAKFINPRPAAGNQTFYNIYEEKGRTGVKIKIDHT